MFRKILLLSVFVIITTIVLATQLNLEECINLGLNNGYKILSNEIVYKNSKSSYNSALYGFLPEASINNSYTKTRLDHNYTIGLSVGKSIYLNDPTLFNYIKAKQNKQISYLTFENTKKEYIYSILDNYLSLIQLQENIKIFQENLDIQKRIYEQIAIEFRNNKKTIYDMQSSQIDTLSSYVDLLNLKKDYKAQRDNFFFLIGVDDNNFDLIEPSIPIVDKVSEFNRNFSSSINDLEIKQSNVTNTESFLSLLPNISLSYNYSISNTQLDYQDLLKQEQFEDSYTIMLSLTYPLFSFLEDGTHYRMQKRNHKKLILDVQNAEDKNLLLYNQAVQEYKNDYTTYEIYQMKYELSKSNMNIAENRFQLGLISSLELDKTRVQYLESQLNFLNKKFALMKKQEEINTLVSGNILGKW